MTKVAIKNENITSFGGIYHIIRDFLIPNSRINELLKNKANLVHSRHRSIHNFIMNLCSALTAYCFFDNKPEALPVYVEKSKQLELFAY